MPVAIALVANASGLVADQYWDRRERKLRDFMKEVSLVLAKVVPDDRVRRLQVVGDSGTTYKVSHAVLAADRKREIAFVEPIPDQQSVDRKFREFSDIKSSEEYDGVARISVYDDRSVWRDGDLTVLGRVSNVVPFADFGTRLQKLVA